MFYAQLFISGVKRYGYFPHTNVKRLLFNHTQLQSWADLSLLCLKLNHTPPHNKLSHAVLLQRTEEELLKTYRDMNHFIQTHIILLSWDNVQALGYWWVLSAHSESLRWLHIPLLLRLLPADTPPPNHGRRLCNMG